MQVPRSPKTHTTGRAPALAAYYIADFTKETWTHPTLIDDSWSGLVYTRLKLQKVGNRKYPRSYP